MIYHINNYLVGWCPFKETTTRYIVLINGQLYFLTTACDQSLYEASYGQAFITYNNQSLVSYLHPYPIQTFLEKGYIRPVNNSRKVIVVHMNFNTQTNGASQPLSKLGTLYTEIKRLYLNTFYVEGEVNKDNLLNKFYTDVISIILSIITSSNTEIRERASAALLGMMQNGLTEEHFLGLISIFSPEQLATLEQYLLDYMADYVLVLLDSGSIGDEEVKRYAVNALKESLESATDLLDIASTVVATITIEMLKKSYSNDDLEDIQNFVSSTLSTYMYAALNSQNSKYQLEVALDKFYEAYGEARELKSVTTEASPEVIKEESTFRVGSVSVKNLGDSTVIVSIELSRG